MTTIKGQATAVVEAPADSVFTKLTDLTALPSWNEAMTRVCEVPDQLAPGAEWVVEFHVLGRTWRSRSRCESIDSVARRFTHRTGTDDGNQSYAEWEWAVEPAGSGSRVTATWTLHPVTFWRRVLLARVRARQLGQREVPASLAALGRVTNRGAVGTTP
ncbi:MAG TPA: SRPBCC family protein [Acidimicrobiales bacterium]|nr:SRPBCC family protein [Acidimicrobiales bacterium]